MHLEHRGTVLHLICVVVPTDWTYCVKRHGSSFMSNEWTPQLVKLLFVRHRSPRLQRGWHTNAGHVHKAALSRAETKSVSEETLLATAAAKVPPRVHSLEIPICLPAKARCVSPLCLPSSEAAKNARECKLQMLTNVCRDMTHAYRQSSWVRRWTCVCCLIIARTLDHTLRQAWKKKHCTQ